MLADVKHLSHKAFLSWQHHQKGRQPRLKRHLLPMSKTGPAGHQPIHQTPTIIHTFLQQLLFVKEFVVFLLLKYYATVSRKVCSHISSDNCRCQYFPVISYAWFVILILYFSWSLLITEENYQHIIRLYRENLFNSYSLHNNAY